MSHRVVGDTPQAPKPVGAYSQAIRVGRVIVTAGQIGADPLTGELVGPDIESQTKQVLKNLSEALASVGGSLSDVVRVGVFLADASDFAAMNAVYGELLPKPYPVRTTVFVGLAPAVRIEIDSLAVLDED
jgi:reactive intermediate/imine deaminase